MFELFDKRKTRYDKTTIYSVRNDRNGYPHFLVFDKGQWKWESAKHFSPRAEDTRSYR